MTVLSSTPSLSDNENVSDSTSLGSRLNWLRAGVLGANDGIVSTAGIVVGVAGATTSHTALLIAGLAGLVAGAFSMAMGEYVSVSTQRDTERVAVRNIRARLTASPAEEKERLTKVFSDAGISSSLSRNIANELATESHIDASVKFQLGIDSDELTNPWHAAIASFLSFTLGALLPLLAIVASPAALRVPITVVAVTLALAVTGALSARLGNAPVGRAVARVVAGGMLAMTATYLVGSLVGLAL